MANLKSAQKEARKNEKRRLKNIARKTALKTAIKKVQSAIEKNLPAEEIKKLMKDAEAKLARAAAKNVLHENTAQRRISRLAQRVTQVTRPA